MSGGTLQLDPRLDLRAATALAKTLVDHRGAALVLDAREVTFVGALAVQAIRAAARTWAQDGHALQFQNVSNDLNDQLGLLGHSPDTLTQWGAVQ